MELRWLGQTPGPSRFWGGTRLYFQAKRQVHPVAAKYFPEKFPLIDS
jgi:hypothetical protein